MGDFDNGEGDVFVETGCIWEPSVLSTPFFCEPKTSLKDEVY